MPCGLKQADEQTEQLVAALREEHEAELARVLDASVAHTDPVQQQHGSLGQPTPAEVTNAEAPPIGPGNNAVMGVYSREERDGME